MIIVIAIICLLVSVCLVVGLAIKRSNKRQNINQQAGIISENIQTLHNVVYKIEDNVVDDGIESEFKAILSEYEQLKEMPQDEMYVIKQEVLIQRLYKLKDKIKKN